jgi:hypothetical protein
VPENLRLVFWTFQWQIAQTVAPAMRPFAKSNPSARPVVVLDRRPAPVLAAKHPEQGPANL